MNIKKKTENEKLSKEIMRLKEEVAKRPSDDEAVAKAMDTLLSELQKV